MQQNRAKQTIVFNHYLISCSHLPESDRRFMSRARLITALDEELSDLPISEDVITESEFSTSLTSPTEALPSSRLVQVKQSPFLNVFYSHHPLKITIDSGAETNMIRESVAKQIGAHITKGSQLALQADGQSPITITGETRLVVMHDNKEFILEAVVAQNVDADVLAGVPFMDTNDIAVRPAKREIILGDGTTYEYGVAISTSGAHANCCTQACVLCAPPKSTTIWPGEFIELDCKDSPDCELALEPHTDCAVNILGQQNNVWPLPRIVSSVAGKIRIPNDTDSPLILQRNQHFAQVCPTFYPDSSPSQSETLPSILNVTRASPTDH